MLTIIESPIFSRMWPDYWTEEERAEFAAFLAANPDAGNVVSGSGGCRNAKENIPAHLLKKIAEEMGYANE